MQYLGMLAGIFNKFGKVGVVIGFALGNIVLAYVANGNSVELIHFKEILIAFVGLLAVPKGFNIELEEFIADKKLLPVMPNRALNRSKETVNSLNNVSNMINEIAKGYKKGSRDAFSSEQEKNINKQIFITELLNNLEPYKENMLYDDVSNIDGNIQNEIFEYVIENQEIDRENLLKIFAKCNSYIVGFDDKEISKYLEDNISEMVRIINMSYKISKIDFIWRKKEEENKLNVEKQLNGVSKAINQMAEEIEESIKDERNVKFEKERIEITELLKQKGLNIEDISIKKENDNSRYFIDVFVNNILEIDSKNIENAKKVLSKVLGEKIEQNEENTVGNKMAFISADKYSMAVGMETIAKNKNKISGDSILNIKLKDGKYLVAISDGMGTGKEAKESSKKVLEMLENLLLSGFDKNTSLDLINTSLIEQNKESFATLDLAIVDLYNGNIEFVKSGACPTFIKKGKKVKLIKSTALPTGIVDTDSQNFQTFDKDIESGEIIVLCSDGILDANVEFKNKELWLKYLLEDLETVDTKKIASLIVNEAIDNSFGTIKDDMSVIVLKIK